MRGTRDQTEKKRVTALEERVGDMLTKGTAYATEGEIVGHAAGGKKGGITYRIPSTAGRTGKLWLGGGGENSRVQGK